MLSSPKVMVGHAALLMQSSQAFAKDHTPLVVCGDFNMSPGSVPYNTVLQV
jgi:endonuclease/exonuclease/phosphatase family metal-dependent hydrolase